MSRKSDGYVTIESTSYEMKIDLEISVLSSFVKVEIVQVVWEKMSSGYVEHMEFDPYIEVTYDSSGYIFIGGASHPLESKSAYNCTVTYNVYEYDELVQTNRILGISTSTATGEDPGGAILSPPLIVSVTTNTFPGQVGLSVTIDDSVCYSNYYVRAYVTDCNGVETIIDVLDDGPVSSTEKTKTYYVSLSKDDYAYGKINIRIETSADKVSDIHIFYSSAFLLFYFNYRTHGEFKITAEEWNDYNDTFASAFAKLHRGPYTYSEVLPGQEMTLTLLNQPINAYYNSFGWYFSENVIPRIMVYYGKLPNGIPGISAYDFFGGLEDMLNSLLATD